MRFRLQTFFHASYNMSHQRKANLCRNQSLHKKTISSEVRSSWKMIGTFVILLCGKILCCFLGTRHSTLACTHIEQHNPFAIVHIAMNYTQSVKCMALIWDHNQHNNAIDDAKPSTLFYMIDSSLSFFLSIDLLKINDWKIKLKMKNASALKATKTINDSWFKTRCMFIINKFQ